MLFTQYEDDRVRLYFKDKAFEKEYHWLQTKLPDKEIAFGARSKDENIWIVIAHTTTLNQARPMFGTVRRRRLYCSTASARSYRERRSQNAGPTISSRPTVSTSQRI
jgi:hypothetical protein